MSKKIYYLNSWVFVHSIYLHIPTYYEWMLALPNNLFFLIAGLWTGNFFPEITYHLLCFHHLLSKITPHRSKGLEPTLLQLKLKNIIRDCNNIFWQDLHYRTQFGISDTFSKTKINKELFFELLSRDPQEQFLIPNISSFDSEGFLQWWGD